jgi:hypothetical protein
VIFGYFMARLVSEVHTRVLDFGVYFLCLAFLFASLGVGELGFVFPGDIWALVFNSVREGHDGLHSGVDTDL